MKKITKKDFCKFVNEYLFKNDYVSDTCSLKDVDYFKGFKGFSKDTYYLTYLAGFPFHGCYHISMEFDNSDQVIVCVRFECAHSSTYQVLRVEPVLGWADVRLINSSDVHVRDLGIDINV